MPTEQSANTPVLVTSHVFNVDTFDKNACTWERWVARLEGAFKIFKTEEAMKADLLLHYVGQTTYNIVCDKLSPTKPTEKSYKELVEVLQEHFDPKPLEIVENYRFHLRKQHEGESAEDFIIALRKLAINCKFEQYLDTALRNQFVFGVRSTKILNRLLEMESLTLDKAVKKASAMELSERGGAEIHNGAVEKVHLVDSHNQTKLSTKNKQNCFRCGSDAHFANACKYAKTICSYCSKVGHLRAVCLTLKNESNPSSRKKGHWKGNQTNFTEIAEIVDIEPEEICNIIDVGESNRSKIFLKLDVNRMQIDFELDSGSPVTLMNMRDKEKYFKSINIVPSDLQLVSYCNQKINVFGFLTVDVASSSGPAEPHLPLKLYIVESTRHPLLGREWINALKINWNQILSVRPSTNESTSPALNVDSSATANSIAITAAVEKLKTKYANVFDASMGKINDIQARIHLKPNTRPVYIKARSVPFAIRTAVEDELAELEANGIITKVHTSAWATPIVPVRKSNNKVRICADYKITVNPNIFIDKHPIPTIEELFASMAGGQKFTKIDLSKAYLQIEIHQDDREILTISTHKGLYQPNRLMYGVASAPGIWQRKIEQILQDIEGVSVFFDDIKITAPTDALHLQRLEAVLKRLSDHNTRVNLNKCEFLADNIEYCGYLIDQDGIHKMKAKVEAIQQMRQPSNREEVRAFVGLINYYGRFLRNLSDTLHPINNLLKKEVPFKWSQQCKDAFEKVKNEMQSESFLVHFDPKLPLVLQTDASPYGVGAVLSHICEDGQERPIQYASQTLSAVQQKYSQVDREAYAIIFGIRKFYQYVYATNFTLVTDNKAITQIFSPTKGLPLLSALRMQHYAVFLESFTYDIKYRPSEQHANADAFSRLPMPSTHTQLEEVHFIELNSIETLPISANDIGNATKTDRDVKILIAGLKSGRLVEGRDRFGIDQNEFGLHDACLMRGIRVYIPSTLRQQVLQELHSTHFGMSRMKELARSYCWWLNIDKDIEEMVRNCQQCQETRGNPTKAPLHVWERPTEPFQRIHADYAGPFMGKQFFILVDAYSKWTEVYIVPNITTDTTIQKCREFFSTFGIPSVFVSDNGTQFTSGDFKTFLKMNGIVHKLSAPYHPATNGQAERYVRTIKEKLKALQYDKGEIHKNLCNILLNYRKMIHPATGKSPSMLVFGRQIRSRMDVMLPSNTMHTEESQFKKARQLEIDDRVAVREYMSASKWKFGKIIERTGDLHYVIKLDDGREWKRHINQIRKVGSSEQDATSAVSDDDGGETEEGNSNTNQTLTNDTSVAAEQETERADVHLDAETTIVAQPTTPNELDRRRDSTHREPVAPPQPTATQEVARRPVRIRRPVVRLAYDRNGNQIS